MLKIKSNDDIFINVPHTYTLVFLIALLIAVVFLVTGHSFLSCDRDFAQIEKRKRLCEAFVPEELQEIVRSKTQNKFNVAL